MQIEFSAEINLEISASDAVDTILDFGVVCPATGLRRLFDKRMDLLLCLRSSSSLFASKHPVASVGVRRHKCPGRLLAERDGDAVFGVLITILKNPT